MSIFSKKSEEDYEDEDYDEDEGRLSRKKTLKKIKDLKPENKRKRKEPPKPWGKKERYLVLGVFVATITLSSLLYTSARSWKLPGLPKISLPSFGEETIVITANKGDKEKAEKTTSSFKQETKNFSGIYAFDVINLESGFSYGVSQTEVMQAASLIKLPIMSLVYKKYEAGELDINKQVPGSKSTYRQLVEAMGKRSDNSAQITLANAFGRDEIQKYIDEIGLTKTSLEENETTPSDVGIFFERLWKGELVSEKSRDEILGDLTDTIYEDWLVAGISDVRVAHKFGRDTHVVNDAGIIYSNKPFILVIMTKGIVEAEADKVIPELARLIYEGETR